MRKDHFKNDKFLKRKKETVLSLESVRQSPTWHINVAAYTNVRCPYVQEKNDLKQQHKIAGIPWKSHVNSQTTQAVGKESGCSL